MLMFLQKTSDWGKGGKMLKDELLFEKVEEMCCDLELPYSTKLLLVAMICRKIKYPEEKMDQIITRVREGEQIFLKLFKKHKGRAFMPRGIESELNNLEEELHECRNLPDELYNGRVIANTVKYYAKKFIDFSEEL